ncbi:hypothetical protein BX666DRAFT_1158406 [Dichotomocladium elegans]|nr:hypothetical protein BX666DRAFT_1158406 [Dichotomocladium elegans]
MSLPFHEPLNFVQRMMICRKKKKSRMPEMFAPTTLVGETRTTRSCIAKIRRNDFWGDLPDCQCYLLLSCAMNVLPSGMERRGREREQVSGIVAAAAAAAAAATAATAAAGGGDEREREREREETGSRSRGQER